MTHAANGRRTYSDVAGWKRGAEMYALVLNCVARHRTQFSCGLAAGLFIKNLIVGIIDLD